MGKKDGWLSVGVIAQWRIAGRLKAAGQRLCMGWTPGGGTFLSSPLPFERSTDSDSPDLCL